MSNRLIIAYSGKKDSGKSNAVKFTLVEFLNRRIGKNRFILSNAKEKQILDSFNNGSLVSIDFPTADLIRLYETYSVKIYNFTDPVKKFCIEALGLDPIQCYGSDEDKSSPTHICWENIFNDIREKYSRPRRGSGGIKPASGFMTAKEVMQVVENDIFRKIDENCWARSLYSMIKSDGYDLAIIANASHPSEVTLGEEIGGKTVRLLKNPSKEKDAMDDFPLGEYSFVLDNSKLSTEETHNKIKPKIHSWFDERKI